MGEQREVRMIHRAQDALGLFGARQVEAAVHRADHQIEPRQHVVRQVEAAVFQDVHLDALQQRDAVQLRIEAVDLVALLRELQRIEAVRHGEAARVLGDGEVFQPERLGRQRHVAQAVVAVGGLGVRMQVAAQVGQFHQLRQASAARRLDLAAVLAQFRRDEGQADSAVAPIPRCLPAMRFVPRNTPYSLTFRPSCCAMRRIAMLCALEPVK